MFRFEDLAIFILLLIGMAMASGLLRTIIRQRHEARMGRAEPVAGPQLALLSSENEGLRRQVGRLEERIAVLERIATDPARRTALEIEELRD